MYRFVVHVDNREKHEYNMCIAFGNGGLFMFNISITERCHNILSEYIGPGDVAIDATCGNGNDTLFLARAVGESGHVFAFDVQAMAIMNTEMLMMEEGYNNVTCINESNDKIDLYVTGKPNIIMYNLGYLPGGDHSTTTQTDVTVASIRRGIGMIETHGVVSIITYPGHEEGAREAAAVEELLRELPSRYYEVLTIKQTNRSETTPVLHLVSRIREGI